MKIAVATLCELDDKDLKNSPYLRVLNEKSYLRILAERMASLPIPCVPVCGVSRKNGNQIVRRELEHTPTVCFEGHEDRHRRLLEAAIHLRCDTIIYIPIGYTAFDIELTLHLIKVFEKNGFHMAHSTRYPPGLVPKIIRRNAFKRLLESGCPWPFYLHAEKFGLKSHDLPVPRRYKYDFSLVAEVEESWELLEVLLRERPHRDLPDVLKHLWNVRDRTRRLREELDGWSRDQYADDFESRRKAHRERWENWHIHMGVKRGELAVPPGRICVAGCNFGGVEWI